MRVKGDVAGEEGGEMLFKLWLESGENRKCGKQRSRSRKDTEVLVQWFRPQAG